MNSSISIRALSGRTLLWFSLLASLAVPTALAARPVASSLAAPAHLLCQDTTEPLAVDLPQPRLSWQLSSAGPALHDRLQSAYAIEVAANRADLLARRQLLWQSGKTSTVPGSLPVALYAGPALEPGRAYWWRVRLWDAQGRPSPWSAPARWQQAPRWQPTWIAAQATDAERLPMPLLRKSFSLPAPVRSATLHISGLGQFEAHLNGRKIGSAELAPGWSDYRKTVFYSSYDVASLLHTGPNALGVLLGNGMFRVQRTKGRYTKFEASFGPPQLAALLQIELVDGRRIELATDATWKAAPGPILFSSIYGGEDYDARREIPGWDQPSFDDRAWTPALILTGPSGQLLPEAAPPSTIQQTYQPQKITTPRPGLEVYDLGQNFAGWPAILALGPAGSTIKLTPGELLNPDGTVSQQSSGHPVWFSYTLKGQGRETWHPRFSYTGFRYLQVELTGSAHLLELTGQAVHSTAPVAGRFSSSSLQLNRIHDLILRAIENNAQSLLTDCPHREKLGWLEQTHLMAPSILYDFDFRGIYAALARNIADAQQPSGMVPEIAPQYVVFNEKWGPYNDSPEWGSAAVLAPWQLYRRTGELAPLLAQLPVMRRYVDYLSRRASGHIVAYGLGDWYDIGPGQPGFSKLTTAGLTATALYYQDLRVLARVFALAGNSSDSAHYDALAEQVKEAFNTRFFDPAHHRYDQGSQTAQAMPLALGLVAPSERDTVLATLLADIRAHDAHITAGEIGYPYLIDILLASGHSDLLLATLLRNDPPSYGSQLARGATALAEAWDASPAHSQDHFMLGAAEEWFYRGLGGIDLDLSRAGSPALRLHPNLLPGLDWVSASAASPWGPIESHWRRHGDSVEYELSIPAGTTAQILLDTANPARILIDGRSPERARGLHSRSFSSNRAEFLLGSGHYRILLPGFFAPEKRQNP